ncbi:MAG: HAMP domain-containing histidine kinase [Actinobacteria bacterium]|nr:HAMP domain-containing histidine kinase [Actinomycetota bacterium]
MRTSTDQELPGRDRLAPLEAFLERSPTVAAAIVEADGAIVSTNPTFVRLAGSPATLEDAVAEGQYNLVAQLLDTAGRDWGSASAGLRTADGHRLDCEFSVRAESGGVLVVVESLQAPADRLNDHLLELNNELIGARRELAVRNRKLRELDELKNMFLASASHDLKTPMSSIVGYAELLGESDLGEAEVAMVAAIERSARRVVSMIEDLLGAALVMTGELRLLRREQSVAVIVRESVGMIEPVAAAGGLTVELTCPDHALAEVDESRIMQILDNLLSNAVKYSPAGGKIEVTCIDGAQEVAISVSDSGIGISKEDQSKLFGRFFRASTAREHGIAGTGLGLANARAFAEAHGGHLDCTSAEGAGSTFKLSLPKTVGHA